MLDIFKNVILFFKKRNSIFFEPLFFFNPYKITVVDLNSQLYMIHD